MDEVAHAVATVEKFLRLVEARNLDEAVSYLAPSVTITFPGGRRFSTLEEQVASSAGRFRSVRKVFERSDAFAHGDEVIVYVFGTLEGEALDGNSFSGVRFIDRFVLKEDRIVDQKVWNDMAESVLGRRDGAD
jgi:hypothetical protein